MMTTTKKQKRKQTITITNETTPLQNILTHKQIKPLSVKSISSSHKLQTTELSIRGIFCSGHLPTGSFAWQWDNARHMLTGLIAATRRFSFWMTGHCLQIDLHTVEGLILSFLSALSSPHDRLLLSTSPWTHSSGFARSVGTSTEVGQRAGSQCHYMHVSAFVLALASSYFMQIPPL